MRGQRNMRERQVNFFSQRRPDFLKFVALQNKYKLKSIHKMALLMKKLSMVVT